MPDSESGLDKESMNKEATERMQKSFDSFRRDIDAIRTNRASSAMVDNIKVEYYGTPTPINQLATVSVPEARVLTIAPFDPKSMDDIERAILKSDLNISPQNDGVVIRIILPELSMERRKELVKQLKVRAEEARVSVRNIRRDINDLVKKSTEHVSEDDIKDAHGEIQKITDGFMTRIEQAVEKKEKDITTV